MPAQNAGGYQGYPKTSFGANLPPTQTPPGANQPGFAQSLGQINSLYNQALPSYLPGIVQAQNQFQQLGSSIPTIMASFGQQAGFTQQEAGLQQQQLGLQGQQLGIQQGALTRQEQLVPSEHRLTEQGLQQQLKDLIANYGYQKQATESQGVAGGSLFTKGQKETQGIQQEQFQSGRTQLGLAQQREALDYRERLASLQDQQKNLGILEKQLGISGEEITSRTQNALSQLGLSQMVSVNQVHQAMIDAENGVTNPLQSILGQVMSLGGIRPVAAGG